MRMDPIKTFGSTEFVARGRRSARKPGTKHTHAIYGSLPRTSSLQSLAELLASTALCLLAWGLPFSKDVPILVDIADDPAAPGSRAKLESLGHLVGANEVDKIVIPSISHFGNDPQIAGAILSLIYDQGAQLITVDMGPVRELVPPVLDDIYCLDHASSAASPPTVMPGDLAEVAGMDGPDPYWLFGSEIERAEARLVERAAWMSLAGVDPLLVGAIVENELSALHRDADPTTSSRTLV